MRSHVIITFKGFGSDSYFLTIVGSSEIDQSNVIPFFLDNRPPNKNNQINAN